MLGTALSRTVLKFQRSQFITAVTKVATHFLFLHVTSIIASVTALELCGSPWSGSDFEGDNTDFQEAGKFMTTRITTNLTKTNTMN